MPGPFLVPHSFINIRYMADTANNNIEKLQNNESFLGELTLEQPKDGLIVNLKNANDPSIIKVIGVGGGGGNAVANMYR